jgi:sugar lactone lactonase YvrE
MQPIIDAPELPADFPWLNTDRPLKFSRELKGHVVLLHFWSYCSINCMHVLADLAWLEEKYRGQPVIILGVHVAKHDNERDPANIRAAIQRCRLQHPVIVDQRRHLWTSYDVNSWPSLVLVGADGRIIGGISGEGHRDLLDKVLAKALAQARDNQTLAGAPLTLPNNEVHHAASGLSFPSKVIPDAARNRLFIVDSNHHRILITGYPGPDGRAPVLDIIGGGRPGADDGTFPIASFDRPQGAALMGDNTLWVADTGNHLVRRIDLLRKTVSTALGTGKQVFDPEAGKTGREQALNSPWDVAVGAGAAGGVGGGNRLYIAQAGQHQLFAMNLMSGMTEIAAGSGRQDLRDGAAANANLAQPSGMALDAKNQLLYLADSETSAVRALDLRAKTIRTIVGSGLFDFGDRDGPLDQARLQHPLGIAVTSQGTALLVADTYNHKIKRIDLPSGTVATLAGTGKPGTMGLGGEVAFFEPASVAVSGEADLFVADTNNHRIVRLNALTGGWMELTLDYEEDANQAATQNHPGQ